MQAVTDSRLRSLERRWRASGAPADGAEFLRERRRAGDLSPEDLQLAAYLGAPEARLALGLPEWPRLPTIREVSELLAPAQITIEALSLEQRKALLGQKLQANNQRRARERLLSDLSALLPAGIQNCPCVYSPVLNRIRSLTSATEKGVGGRRPAGYRYEESENRALILEQVAAFGELHATEEAILLLGGEAPAFCVPFSTGVDCLLSILRNHQLLLAPLVVATSDLRAGTSVDHFVEFMSQDLSREGLVFEVASWGSRASR